MSLSDQIHELEYKINVLAVGVAGISKDIDKVLDKQDDIGIKLDKALAGNDTEKRKTPHEMLSLLRFCIVYATSNRKIEAIKALREATGASLVEAKGTVEWITERVDNIIQERREAE